jgi:hypothetical protein
MTKASIAPCGINCDLCSAFTRKKNRCVGCNNEGDKVPHCATCSIRTCPEKGDYAALCAVCAKFPCQKIKHLDKRYRLKYGESIIDNLNTIGRVGLDAFILDEEEKWRCPSCGNTLCVHKDACPVCGAVNTHYPRAV